jgi:glycosyltransferase involved in cell wall biosynthesis
MVQRWHIAANFFTDNSRWLDDFIDDERLSFTKIPAGWRDNWHQRGKVTGVREWLAHFRHAWSAMRGRPDGVITCFPQLAICAGTLKALGFGRPRIVAHNFNLGEISSPLKRRLASWASRYIDRFLVHSPVEVERYARWLGLPADRFEFVPLQRGAVQIERNEETVEPFILAMGSAHRDYDTLIRAVVELGIRTVIVTRQDEIDRLPKPANVEFKTGLTETECLELLSRARLSVTPIGNMETASGQITFINAMQLGVPVLATRCPGADGYIEDGETGILLEPFAVGDMRMKIDAMWSDAGMRKRIADTGKKFANNCLSDEGAAETLLEILLSFHPT